MTEKITTVYVELLEEGTDTLRGTDAIDFGNGLYKLLPTPNYDPEDEIWAFLPHSVVKAKMVTGYKGEQMLVAYEKAE